MKVMYNFVPFVTMITVHHIVVVVLFSLGCGAATKEKEKATLSLDPRSVFHPPSELQVPGVTSANSGMFVCVAFFLMCVMVFICFTFISGCLFINFYFLAISTQSYAVKVAYFFTQLKEFDGYCRLTCCTVSFQLR